MSYSQLDQDLNVISFFGKKINLFFLDIGAFDGITISNTYLLEKEFKWNGLCVEPLPDEFKKLCECRNVQCDNSAIYSESGLLLEFSNSSLFSGITSVNYNNTYLNNNNLIMVKTITLDDLLKNYKAPSIIHYLSLNTEGSEFEIIKFFNFNKYIFLYINIQHNYGEPIRTNIRNLLLNNGYLYKGENQWDDDYIHESNIIGTYYYMECYTKPIVIIKKDKNKFVVSSTYWNDDEGEYIDGSLCWKTLGTGKIYYTHIDFGNENIWHRDKRK